MKLAKYTPGDASTATPTDIKWALRTGYVGYLVAFVFLAAAAVGSYLVATVWVAFLVGLSATAGWIGAMLQIHALAWDRVSDQ